MSEKMFAPGDRARLLDGSEIEILDACEDDCTYRVRIMTGPVISLVRNGRLLHVRDIIVPEENVEPLVSPAGMAGMDAFFAGPTWRRC